MSEIFKRIIKDTFCDFETRKKHSWAITRTGPDGKELSSWTQVCTTCRDYDRAVGQDTNFENMTDLVALYLPFAMQEQLKALEFVTMSDGTIECNQGYWLYPTEAHGCDVTMVNDSCDEIDSATCDSLDEAKAWCAQKELTREMIR